MFIVYCDLQTCTHVFVRRDSERKPLQPPYDGPFKVVSRSAKHFVLELNNRRATWVVLLKTPSTPSTPGPLDPRTLDVRSSL